MSHASTRRASRTRSAFRQRVTAATSRAATASRAAASSNDLTAAEKFERGLQRAQQLAAQQEGKLLLAAQKEGKPVHLNMRFLGLRIVLDKP